MRLVVVGCSGSMSGPDSAASSYLVEADDGEGRTWRVLLDLGSGAFGQLLRYADPAGIDAVAVSHLHPDHVVDLTGFEVYRRYHPDGALPPVPLFGPPGTADRVLQLGGDSGEEARAKLGQAYTVTAYDTGQGHRVGPLHLEPVEVHHPVTAYGLRVRGPREDGTGEAVLAYTGDTDTCPGLLELARDADLLLAEAAYQEGRDTGRGIHLTGRRAAEAAADGRSRRLVLTHLPPWNDAAVVRAEAEAVYDGPIELAVPGATWRL